MGTCHGCEVRPELHYDAEYQIWARVESDGTVSIGMTDISQTKAGKIMHVRVRRPGSRRPRGKPVATVETGKWAGWVFVKAILGGNEDTRLGAQRPGEADYAGTWGTVIKNVLLDVTAAVERYGTELGVCGVCNRQLTNEESRQGGIGPVCRARLDKRETIFSDTDK